MDVISLYSASCVHDNNRECQHHGMLNYHVMLIVVQHDMSVSRRWDSNPRVLSQAHYKCAPFDRFGTSACRVFQRGRVLSPRARDRNATLPSRITAGPHRGSVVEWLMAPGCKPGSRRRYAGSNPARPTMASKRASPQGTRAAVSVPHEIERGRCIMVMPLPSKQESRVRFPPPAPHPPESECRIALRTSYRKRNTAVDNAVTRVRARHGHRHDGGSARARRRDRELKRIL